MVLIDNFTKEEVKALKELAREKIFSDSIMQEGATYRNKFETWDDAYINLGHLGFSHEAIIKRIGRKK